MTLDEIVTWLNDTYPDRDWDQDCQRLVWNTVWAVSGVDESVMNPPYPTATAARLASVIDSKVAAAAPVGAIHYFLYPAAGHVGVGLGGESVLMTGTKAALGKDGVLLGGNYGVTTVSAYVEAMRNPYLGWARTNGRYPSIIGAIGEKPKPAQRKRVNRSMNMLGMYIGDGEGRYGAKDGKYWATFDPGTKTITYLSSADAKAVSETLGTSFGNFTYAGWEGYHAQAATFIDATTAPPKRVPAKVTA